MTKLIFQAVGKTRYLALLLVLLLTYTTAWGADPTVTIQVSSDTWTSTGTSGTGSETSVTKDGITVSSTKGYKDGTNHIRDYQNSVITISSTVGNIKSIAFTCTASGTSNNGPGKLSKNSSSDAGSYSYSGSVGTWSFGTGTSTVSSVQLKATAQCRWTQVVVTYVASASVSAPTFGVAAGTYSNNQSVTLSCATAGATIYYTSSTNGVAPADPTSSSTAYSSAITVNHDNTIIKAIAIKGGTNSTVASATYRLTCATPTFSPTAGEYVGTQSVTISSETSNANIYYTTNSSTPTTSSTLYSGAITVSSSQTIKALVTKSNYTNSAVGSAAYTITPAYTVTWKNKGSNVTTTNVASGSKPVFPDMSAQSGCGKYTYFYGWAEDTWSGEVSSPGTSSTVKVYKVASEMPNVSADVTYHAVWSDTQGGYALVESNLGTSWAGDYLIAYSSTVFADGRVGGTGTGGIGKQYVKANPGDNLSGKVVNATWGDTYHVTLEEILDNNDDPTNTYLLKTQDGQYNYQTSNANGLTSTSTRATAANYPITVTFTSSSDVKLGLGGSAAGAVFRYNTSEYFRYYKDGGQNAVYLYKKGANGGKCVTSCCNELGTINGGLTLTQGGNSVTISGWTYNAGLTGTTESNIASYTVRMYKKNGASWDLVSGTKANGTAGTEGTRTGIATNSKSVTFTGLVVESEYKFTIAAVGASGYCDIAETAITSINSTDVSSTPFKFRYSIYIDNGSGSGWTHNYITPTANADEGSVSITLSAHVTSYQFKIFGGFSGDWGQTGSDGVIPASTKWTLNGSFNVKLNTGAGGAYTFTVDYSGTTNPGVTVTFPSANQDPGYVIYYDNSVLNWSSLYYRIGNNSTNSKTAMTLVPGTDKFYKVITPDYDDMDAWHIANNYGWAGSGNSIYRTKTNNEQLGIAITNSINFQQYAVTEDITIIPTTTHSTGGDDQNNNCQFYTINTPTSGMLTHTATITAPSNGTINLAYTDVNSAAQNKTSTTVGLAHRTKITASATPATGYQLSTFTVTPSGESAQNLTSGATDNHILAKDATFAAAFTAKTYNISLDREGATTGSENVTMTYNSAEHTAITAPSKDGYTFGGWYTDDNGTGTQVMNASGVLQAGVDGYTGAGGIWIKDATCTLYAKWTPTPYTIAYDLAGGDVATPNPTSYTIESSAITLNNPTKDGYDFAGWTGTDLGSATMTVTIAAGSTGNRSYTATWSIKHYTVTWLSNGANYITPVDYTHGASLALPAGTPSVPIGCSTKNFVGWAETNEITSETHSAPTFLDAGSLGTVTSNKTYRAVFADGSSSTVYKWIRHEVTSEFGLGDLSEGTWALVTSDGYVFNGSTDNGHGQKTESAASFTNDEVASLPDGACELTFTQVKDNGNVVGYTVYNATTEKYLYASKNSSGGLGWHSTETSYWTIANDNFVYNSVSARLRVYDNTFRTYSGNNNNNMYLAKYSSVTVSTLDNYITLCETCTDPSNLASSNVTSSGAKITWDGVSLLPTEGFKVVWSTSSSRPGTLNASNSADVAAGTNEYTITGLAATTKYYVWVQSKCNSNWAGSINFTTKAYHTATFIGADGSTLQSGNIDEGAPITYSGETPVTCDDGADPSNYFVGWATDVWSGKVAKASIVPTFYDTETAGEYLPNMGASNVTLYAVFAKRSGTPPTEKEWSYTFTTNKYGSSGLVSDLSQSLDGTEGESTVNKTWILNALGPYNDETFEFDPVNMGTKDNDKGIKIGKNDEPAEYMYFSSTGFTGTITAVKVSTSGGSMTQTSLSLNVDGTDFRCNNNETVNITSSNAEYSFTGSKSTSGGEIQFTWEQTASNSKTALYIKQIEVDYSTGGDISYSNYMTSCNPCVTPSGLAVSSITESGAHVTWSGTSNSSTEGFKVAWNTSNSVPGTLNASNSADVAKNVKQYDITGLSAGTTYYVFVQSKCNDSWSSSATFTTLAVHTISFAADNGSISGGSISSGSGTASASASIVNGQTLTFPSLSSTSCGTFIGWITGTYDATTAPATVYLAGDEMENITAAASYNAVYRVASGAPQNVTDNLVPGDFAATSTSYVATNNLTKSSAAVYEAVTAKGYSAIQINKISDERGIVSKISGGVFKGITLTTNANHGATRKVYVYGSSSYTAAYADPAAFNTNSSVRGTLLATLEGDTKSYTTSTDDYEYIAIFADGAGYLDQIDISWFGSPMKYMTTPECGPVVELTSSFSKFSYIYAAGPSASQSFTVGGMNLGSNNLVVTAPTNYEVCKTADGTYTTSVSYTPTDGIVSTSTVYIRLAAGLSVGHYDYALADGLQVSSTGATTRKAALEGEVTKATGTFTWTDFNAVDHYEGELTGASVAIPYNYTYVGDGTVSLVRVGGYGTVQTGAKTYTLTAVGTYQLRAEVTGGTNYTNPANTLATFIVYKADRFYDNLHGNDMILKRNDAGEDHYTIPTLTDESRLTSGSCSETHYHFMGWVPESALSSLSNDAAYDAVMITGGGTQSATGTNYYAVWAEE